MSIVNIFDCPYHFKKHPCPDCVEDAENLQAYHDDINSEIYEYLNR